MNNHSRKKAPTFINDILKKAEQQLMDLATKVQKEVVDDAKAVGEAAIAAESHVLEEVGAPVSFQS